MCTGRERDRGGRVTRLDHREGGTVSATLNPAPYTLHPTPHTQRPAPYTLHPTRCTLLRTPYTLHPTPYTPRPTLYTLDPTPQTPNLKPFHTVDYGVIILGIISTAFTYFGFRLVAPTGVPRQ